MKLIIIPAVVCLLSACADQEVKTKTNESVEQKTPEADGIVDTMPPAEAKTYGNTRFKDVSVKKSGENQFTVEGKGQIFEANFGWVVEDGHQEIRQGNQMTDAGAPAWGKFKFTVDVKKQTPHSTLTLILFETSAKDGSRVHELPIVLQ